MDIPEEGEIERSVWCLKTQPYIPRCYQEGERGFRQCTSRVLSLADREAARSDEYGEIASE